MVAMSVAPNDIPSLGSATQVLRPNPQFEPNQQGQFTAEDYYLWSRVDGVASIKQLILMAGFPTAKTVGILQRLRDFGAVLMPGETPETVAQRDRAPVKASEPVSRDLGELTELERAAMAEEVAMSDEDKRTLIAMRRTVATGDLFALLSVSHDADKKTLKRAYFKLSKRFHPDRYYGKELGTFGEWLEDIFAATTRAFTLLADKNKREAYLAKLSGTSGGGAAVGAPRTQSKQEHAEALFEHGCALEAQGDFDNALKRFKASITVVPKSRSLRRAATCALRAHELSLAEEYAKKARDLEPADPSYLRVLARVYEAADKLQEAEHTLEGALDLKTENDILVSEIKSDLARVRKAREAR